MKKSKFLAVCLIGILMAFGLAMSGMVFTSCDDKVNECEVRSPTRACERHKSCTGEDTCGELLTDFCNCN
jgi:hypothetical protein